MLHETAGKAWGLFVLGRRHLHAEAMQVLHGDASVVVRILPRLAAPSVSAIGAKGRRTVIFARLWVRLVRRVDAL